MLGDKLFVIQENGDYLPEINNLEDLMEAVNDWPKVPYDLDDYLNQLRDFLNEQTISISVIRKARPKLNPSLNAWEMESLASLHRFMNMNSAESLEDLFSTLKKYI